MNEKAVSQTKGFVQLLLSFLLIIFFVFILAPTIDKIPIVKPLIKFIDERDIDAGALYYTDIGEFSDAEINMQNTIDFSPQYLTGIQKKKENTFTND